MNNTSKLTLLILLPAALAAAPALATTKQTGTTPVNRATQAAQVTEASPFAPGERKVLTRMFEEKWGHYVERVYEIPRESWSARMASTFAGADPANFRGALQRDTFEGAMAELTGTGHRVSDDDVIRRMAASPDAATAGFEIQALGSLSSDLTYTPLPPCRIVDTRVSGGAIAANGTRSFKAVNSANFTSQGGSATNCGTLGLAASAVALNVTAVTPSGAGFATVYPFGASQPVASSVNYTAGAVVNNSIISAIPNPLQSSDFTVYTFAQSHYVIDIVGYFAAPVATAMECTGTFAEQNVTANATFDIAIPSCPTGYTLMGAGCRTPGFNEADWAINGLFRASAGSALGAYCSGLNTTAGTITVSGTANCCRVPGR